MEKTFTYESKWYFLFRLVFLTLILGIIRYYTDSTLFILAFCAFLPIIVFHLHRTFFVTITFTEDKVIYKSFRRKITIEYKDIRDIYLVDKPSARNQIIIDYKEFLEMGKNSAGFMYLMIGNYDNFPGNPYYIITRPVASNYITLRYRKELKELLMRILDNNK